MTGNLIADFDPTANVTEVAGNSEYVWVFGRWMRRPQHCAPEVPKPDSQQRKRKCRHASHDREKSEHGCVREAPRPDTVEKPRDNGKRRRCESHDKKLVEVKAEDTDIKAEKSITPRRQASESPYADGLDFAIAKAEKGRASKVATWKKLANGKGKPPVERSELAGPPGLDRELFNHNFQSWEVWKTHWNATQRRILHPLNLLTASRTPPACTTSTRPQEFPTLLRFSLALSGSGPTTGRGSTASEAFCAMGCYWNRMTRGRGTSSVNLACAWLLAWPRASGSQGLTLSLMMVSSTEPSSKSLTTPPEQPRNATKKRTRRSLSAAMLWPSLP